MKSNPKITVIGGAGFVGTHLCQRFVDRKIPFEIIDIKLSQRFPDKCKAGDVRDINSLRSTIEGDIVVNLAAVHRDDVGDKSEYFDTNVFGAANIAQVCSEKSIRKIVFTSSVAVYGFARIGTDEAGEIRPFNDYGATKYQAEEELRVWQASGDNALLIIRPTVIFGEGNRGNVFNLLSQIASGKFVMIGDGKNLKSMAYIGNVVAFLEKCVDADQKYAVFNYVDTPDMDMNTLVCRVRKALRGKDGVGLRLPLWIGILLGYATDIFSMLTGKKFPISLIRIKKFSSSTSFLSAKYELEGFLPPFSLQEGLERTLHCEFISPDIRREVFYTE
jgi:nucleoside-diphosphate-sugar epimerase